MLDYERCLTWLLSRGPCLTSTNQNHSSRRVILSFRPDELPTMNNPSSKSRGRIRPAVVVLTAMFVIVAALTGAWRFAKQNAIRERGHWRNSCLERLAGLTIENEEIGRELEQLRSGPKPNVDFGWAHDEVLLMANGEFIIFAFWHSPYHGFVGDLFLGRTSDGRWLYSSYHFCNRMAAVRGDDPPKSIAEFETRYSVREFDGKSDKCLQATWPQGK